MENKKNLISIIVPVFNKELSIAETLESIYNQTIDNFEVIIIDDGSTDNTKNIIESFDRKIKYISQPNQGQAVARNNGIKISSGEYIVFLDADDFWDDSFLEECYDFLENNIDIDAVNTAQKIIYSSTKYKIRPKSLIQENVKYIDNFFSTWAKHDHIRTGTAMMRAELVQITGFQNPNLRVSQDLEYWGLLATYGEWGFISKPLWIGNSRVHAKKSGWNKKYFLRRKYCPDVEEWEKRIVNRISKNELSDFKVVRGRVALGYAHNKILGGDIQGAKNIVSKYGKEFPINNLSKLLNWANEYKKIIWFMAIQLIILKERLKT